MKRKLLVFLFVLFLWGCESTTSETTRLDGPVTIEIVNIDFSDGLDYDDFTHIEQPEWQLLIDQAEYYIYFYQTTCSACNSIKADVLEKVATLETDIVYFVRIQEVSDVSEAFNFQYIPTIVHIVNGDIDSESTGESSVLDVLEGLV